MIDINGMDLVEKFEEAKKMLKNAKTKEEKVALVNYIGNLYKSMLCMGITYIKYDRNKFFAGKKTYNKSIKKIEVYSDRQFSNYILHKDFHHQYFGEILPDVEDGLIDICSIVFPKEETLTRSEGFDILNEFFKSIKLQELFDEYYKNGRLHSSIVGESEDNLGFTLFNPINKDTDIFVKEYNGDFTSIQTLIHEIGHGYDLRKIDNIEDYNDYFYLSFYGETIPRLFERLMFRFLINNGIKKELAQDKLVDFVDLNHDFLLQAYLLSVLDEDFLRQGKHLDSNPDELAKKVKKHFLDEQEIKNFIERVGDFDLSDTYNYAYGDIVSLFLCEEVEQVGFTGDLLRHFDLNKTKPFNPEFLRECGFGPDNYTELFKKELKLVRK